MLRPEMPICDATDPIDPIPYLHYFLPFSLLFSFIHHKSRPGRARVGIEIENRVNRVNQVTKNSYPWVAANSWLLSPAASTDEGLRNLPGRYRG
jgi:hypothetical protein